MHFEKIDDKDFADIADIQSRTQYNGSEYSLLYLKGWDFFNYQNMNIAREDGVIYIRFKPRDKFNEDGVGDGNIYLPPLCALDKIKDAYAKIEEQCREDGEDMYVMSTPQEYVDILGDEYEYLENADYAEYLYEPQSLMTYAGKKLHSKRNHVNNFVKAYASSEEGGCVFRDYNPQDRGRVMAFINGWEESKEFDKELFNDMADNEVGVINIALDLVAERDNYFADIIEYDGKIIGFSLGEITPSGIGITHIEKGDVNYDGVYAYLCQAFAIKHYGGVRLINRQEDMGLEGLRKSKQSYRPIAFCKKYAVKKACRQ
ncbi:MAG: phosphatidylglycerol lysyltransferase domain-containing protein [Clostridia bacterium]|nr:phosphatidylglycerol lysyltransferase domain-containing protein [Clostridia bacterium]